MKKICDELFSFGFLTEIVAAIVTQSVSMVNIGGSLKVMKSDHKSRKNASEITELHARIMSTPAPGFLLAGYIERPSEYVSEDHSHNFWQIIIVLGGTFIVESGGMSHILSAGWVHILPPGKSHILKSGPEGYSQVGIDIDSTSPEGVALTECFDSAAIFRSPDAERIGYVIKDNIKSCIKASDELVAGCVKSVVWASVAERQRTSIAPAARTLSEWIDLHLCERMTLERIAGEMFLSVPHLERICRKSYGCGVIALINKRRFERASSYLLATQLTVGEIAETVGFEEVSNFSAFFRRHAGVSPRNYRKR